MRWSRLSSASKSLFRPFWFDGEFRGCLSCVSRPHVKFLFGRNRKGALRLAGDGAEHSGHVALADRRDSIDVLLDLMSAEAVMWTLTCRGLRVSKRVPLVILPRIRKFAGPILREKPDLRAGLKVMALRTLRGPLKEVP